MRYRRYTTTASARRMLQRDADNRGRKTVMCDDGVYRVLGPQGTHAYRARRRAERTAS